MQGLDCLQPSIFSYFHSSIERVEGIARELDARAKRKTDWVGVMAKKNRGAVDIFGKKLIHRFSRNGKFLLAER